MNRRTFLAAAAAAAAPLTAGGRLHVKPGIQLYTVRNSIEKSPEATYRALAGIGYRDMEGRLEQIEPHWPLIRSLRMRWVNWMIPTPAVTGNYEAWDEFGAALAKAMNRPASANVRKPLAEYLATARKYKVSNVGISNLAPGERTALAKTIESINRAGEQCRAAGLRLYYHNHANEFAGSMGSRPIDTLVKELSPRVWFELDVFWLAFAGQDPVEWIERLAGRVLSLHLKDIAADAPSTTSENAMKPAHLKEVGSGRMDWGKVLAAARKARVRHYFVEQDYTPGDPVDSARKSFEYLQSPASA